VVGPVLFINKYFANTWLEMGDLGLEECHPSVHSGDIRVEFHISNK
jgi:hypothetical protein